MTDSPAPANIALVGAPSSGKSQLAEALAESLDGVEIVDQYVKKTAEDADLALGEFATYFGNVAVAIARVGAERKAVSLNPNWVITCGSHIDTMAYSAINASFEQEPDEKRNEIHLVRTEIFMRFLGMLSQDTFGYDHIFYLPLPDSDEHFFKLVDQELQSALEIFKVAFVRLDGTPEEQLAIALEEIHK